jgi:hypothetical protein
MNQIKRILYFIISFGALVTTSVADGVINLEVKVFGRDVIFVFYHEKYQILDFSFKEKKISVNVNIPSDFKLVNKNKFNEYARGLKVFDNKQSLTFNVNTDLEYGSIINGEKLDAIKFRLPDEKQTEDLSLISSANNDPGGINYKKQGEEHILSFNLGNNKNNAAVFFRGKYLWVVLDQKKVFSFKNKGVFSNFELVPSSDGTVFRLRVEDGYSNAKLSQNSLGWELAVSKKSMDSVNVRNILEVESLTKSGEDGVLVRGNFKSNSMVTFQDPEVGDVLNVLTVGIPGMRVGSKIDSVEFSVLKSIQGVAVSLYSDDVKIEKSDKEIKIISEVSLPNNVEEDDQSLFPSTIEGYLKLPTILPYLDKNLDILNFNQQKSKLISEASEAIDGDEQFTRNFELAKFLFINGLYQESLDAVILAKQNSPTKYQSNLQARFLTAVNYTMTDDYSKAKQEYDELLSYQDISQISEINLWNKYNNFSLGETPKSIGFVENLAKTINYYSDDKYWPMLFAEIEIELLANNLKIVEKLLKEHRYQVDGSKYANSLKFYQAEYYRKKGQSNLAKQLYGELINSDDDLFNATRAEFSLVKIRVKEGDMRLVEAIECFEGLRFQWRGDQLEYEILMQLASYYKENNDIMNSLRMYQYIQSAFNNKVSNFYITSEMARIFNDVFLDGGLGEKMDDFTIVALFYEFKELNPIGEQGDDVIIGITKRLVRLDLLDNAADLLRHQIKYRLQGEKRVLNADNLALVLLMDKKPNEAMLVLDDTDKDNFNFKEHQYRARLRSRALIDLEKYEDAIEYLKDDDTQDAEIIRREALFRGKHWDGYVDRINSNFDQVLEKLDEKNPASIQDILRLAIAYYMLNKQDSLGSLISSVGTKDQTLKNTIELLATGSGVVDYRNLDKSLNVDQMKMLLEKYKNQFLSV